MMALAPSPVALWIADIVPDRIKRLVGGPLTRVRIAPTSVEVIGTPLPGRPIAVELDADLVLTTWLTLPGEAKREAREAAVFQIETETPFRAGELSIRITPDQSFETTNELTYRIDATPLRSIEERLSPLRVGLWSVAKMSMAPKSGRAISFPVQTLRSCLLRSLAWLMPVTIITVGLVAVAFQQADRQRVLAASLEAKAENQLIAVSAAQAELEALEAQLSRRATLIALLSKYPSSFIALNALKKGIPEDVQIQKLEMVDGKLILAVRTDITLAAIRAMNALPGWRASAMGSISIDQSSGQEVSTLVVEITP